ncbi:RNA-directed DNA polymerase from mobile element jockey [Araneus ventricosus]|uniref:RNA-directed DNA polymerase from mobile element jockey n=1 Tax=Araneus ventricosus TaxID=182803 RepID=A0A4Y2TN12_ARAVE|nr:RNA-directed DNA polymerase from mobile element jockey [Araneus ventricosus]
MFHKILIARARKKFIYGISFDIKAAYDNVWHDGVVFKLLQSGIDGKMALWISRFLQDRKAFVYWRGVSSSLFKQERGVPQGSVLSPLLYTIFMNDIYKVLTKNVTCLIYADDIFILVEEDSLEMVKNKMNFCVSKLETWCREWHMDIAPQKSNIINFSARKSSSLFHIYFRVCSIPWVDTVRFLGIQYSANFSFRSHIEQLKIKAIKKLNVIKALASPRWGASASDLLRICNACIIQAIEYGAHTVGMTNKKGFESLQVIQNNIIRFAFGLPRWTPIPILHKVSKEINVPLRFDKRNMTFFIKQFSDRAFTEVSSSIITVNSIISSPVYNRLPCGAKMEKYTRLSNVQLDKIIPSAVPVDFEKSLNFVIRTRDFNFQHKSNNPNIIGIMFQDFKSHLNPDQIILATDASKTASSTAIAAINCSSKVMIKGTIHNTNSVYSAEGFAIALAVMNFVNENKKYIIFTDSMSNLMALKNLNFHSPRSSLSLAQIISEALQTCISLELIYIPAHVGLPENEWADSVAKQALTSPQICDWISPDDAVSACAEIIRQKQDEEWRNSKYYDKYKWLNEFDITKLKIPRRYEVLILRLVTRSLPVKDLLHKCRLVDSPNCLHCQVPETCEHIILSCPCYETARDIFRTKMGCIPLSYDWICVLSSKDRSKIKAILAFLSATGRFLKKKKLKKIKKKKL